MAMVIGLIGNVAGLAAFVLGIMCAIKMFQANQIWQGIVTILCWIFGIIYVMQKKEELGLQKLAMPYLATGVVSIVCAIIAAVLAPRGVVV